MSEWYQRTAIVDIREASALAHDATAELGRRADHFHDETIGAARTAVRGQYLGRDREASRDARLDGPTRPALATGAVAIRADGRLDTATPFETCAGSAPRLHHVAAGIGVMWSPDPQAGSAFKTLGALEVVPANVTQIPDARRHVHHC